MGTSEFAVVTLQRLLESPHQVVGIVTAPDKPAGRSLKLAESPVKQFARGLELPLLQPEDLSDPFFLKSVAGLHSDAAVVVAFRILPVELFSIPTHGCINLHASLLPKLRGAAPIQWALMRGEATTGVTTFQIDRKVDTGGILLQREEPILQEDDAASLSGRLAVIGSAVMIETLEGVAGGTLEPLPQSGPSTSAPKITRETAVINWLRPAVEIHNQIRGLSPDPAATTMLEGKRLKIFRSRLSGETSSASPGSIVRVSKESFSVATGEGTLEICELQIEGKKRIGSSEFLKGRRLLEGTILG